MEATTSESPLSGPAMAGAITEGVRFTRAERAARRDLEAFAAENPDVSHVRIAGQAVELRPGPGRVEDYPADRLESFTRRSALRARVHGEDTP